MKSESPDHPPLRTAEIKARSDSRLKHHRESRLVEGFSLVEVTLAIGLVSFCLLGLMGLMPVGFNAVKTARQEAAADNCMKYIATTIRKSGADAAGVNYRALGAFSNLSWSVGGPDVAATIPSLTSAGTPTATSVDTRFVARVEIHPPADPSSSGTALISVAWPQSSSWRNNVWQNSEGSVSTWLVFLPSP